jgi:uncharacterized protein YdeI (BOF family)
LKNKSVEQLRGVLVERSGLDSCEGALTNKEMGKTTSYDGSTLEEEAVAVPCGSMAKSIFNDRYTLEDSSGKSIAID